MIDEKRTEHVRRRYNANARWFDVMDRMMRDDIWMKKIFSQARGRVLEIGVGTGKNLPHYDPAVTAELTAIDLSPGMLQKARTKPCPVPLTLLEMDAQHMSFPDASFDTVVATCVFCTVPDPVLGLKEARRVCKPGGRVILYEHMRLERPIIGPLMDLVDPVVVALIGTHINRRTLENIRAAGLTIESTENVKGDLLKLIYARP
ncbi:MAG TPA: class I SAM-dependent methyltransferase [Symbiobacteriaceae bacterium]|nr:class I SAM-dependent methyltransferase [Symbiobacteriaceae bacterium]